MHSFDPRMAGLLAAVVALASCHPVRDARPPYHEPAAARAAPNAKAPTSTSDRAAP